MKVDTDYIDYLFDLAMQNAATSQAVLEAIAKLRSMNYDNEHEAKSDTLQENS